MWVSNCLHGQAQGDKANKATIYILSHLVHELRVKYELLVTLVFDTNIQTVIWYFLYLYHVRTCRCSLSASLSLHQHNICQPREAEGEV